MKGWPIFLDKHNNRTLIASPRWWLNKGFCLYRYTWKKYSERLLTLAGVYAFWKHVSKLERRETRRYLEMFYSLKFRDLVSVTHSSSFDVYTYFTYIILFFRFTGQFNPAGNRWELSMTGLDSICCTFFRAFVCIILNKSCWVLFPWVVWF